MVKLGEEQEVEGTRYERGTLLQFNRDGKLIF
jgi:hypothetical protein